MAFESEDFASAQNPLSGDANWHELNATNIAGSGKAAGSQFVSALANTNDQGANVVTIYDDDQYAEATLTIGTGTVEIGVVMRGSVDGSDERAWVTLADPTNVITGWYDAGGTFFAVDTTTSTFVTGDRIRAEAVGLYVYIYRQAGGSGAWTLFKKASMDAAPSYENGNVSPGVYVSENGESQVALDDWIGGDAGHYDVTQTIVPRGARYVTDTGATPSQSVDVPAGTTFALVYLSYDAGGSDPIDSLTFGGVSGTLVIEETSNSFQQGALYRVALSSTGSQTLSWTYNSGTAPSNGATGICRFFSGVDATSPIRASGKDTASVTSATGVSVTLTGLTVDDMVCSFSGSFANAGVMTQGMNIYELYQNSASAVSSIFYADATSENVDLDDGESDFPHLFAVALAPTGGGASSTPKGVFNMPLTRPLRGPL